MNTTISRICTIDLHTSRRRYISRLRVNLSLAVALILIAAIILIPYLWMVTTSFKETGRAGEAPFLIPVKLLIEKYGVNHSWRDIFDNYLLAWRSVGFMRLYVNTAFVALAVIVARIVFVGMAAYAFAFLKFTGRDILFLAFLGTMMIPFQSISIPNFLIMRDLHWLNTYQALIVPRMVDAFSIFLLRQSFLTIPQDYLDAARIDGCSHWDVLWRIVMPISRSTVVTMALFTFLFVWNDFFWPMLVANKPEMHTIQYGLRTFLRQHNTEWPILMAGTVTATIIPILLYIIAQKQFISGLSRSGLKG